jgi:uncharacterized protein YcgI (DUF1989 family)
VVVPAREGRAVAVRAHQQFRIVDLEGQQVGDLFAFAAGDISEYHSAEHTRGHVNRLFPAVGEQFVTNCRRPILRLVADTSPGNHDMMIAACDPQRYRGLGVSDWHPSCAENLRTALAALGHTPPVIPQPINVFMNIPVSATGALDWLPAASHPDDSVIFQAEIDCIVVVSACPQDLVEINGAGPTSLAVDLLTDDGRQPA